MSGKQPYAHAAVATTTDPHRKESVCSECGRPVVRVRAGSKQEHWQHSPTIPAKPANRPAWGRATSPGIRTPPREEPGR